MVVGARALVASSGTHLAQAADGSLLVASNEALLRRVLEQSRVVSGPDEYSFPDGGEISAVSSRPALLTSSKAPVRAFAHPLREILELSTSLQLSLAVEDGSLRIAFDTRDETAANDLEGRLDAMLRPFRDESFRKKAETKLTKDMAAILEKAHIERIGGRLNAKMTLPQQSVGAILHKLALWSVWQRS